MNIQLFPEKVAPTSRRIKLLARLSVLLSMPLNKRSPQHIERILTKMFKKYPNATEKNVKIARNAICLVNGKCRNQEGCLKRSLAVIFMLRLQHLSASWCTGYASDPFRAHAWVEVNGIPVDEHQDMTLFHKVIDTSENI